MAEKTRKWKMKKSTIVFHIIFLVLLLLGVAGAVFLFAPVNGNTILNGVSPNVFSDFVNETLENNFGLSNAFNGNGAFYSAVAYTYFAAVFVFLILYFVFVCFLVLGNVRRRKKKCFPYRLVLEIVTMVLNVAFLLFFVAYAFQNMLGSFFTWGVQGYQKFIDLFHAGNPLAILVFPGYSNLTVIATFYAFCCLIVVNLVLHLFVMIGARHDSPAAVPANTETATAAENGNVYVYGNDYRTANAPVKETTPIVAASFVSQKADDAIKAAALALQKEKATSAAFPARSKVQPTYRELCWLNFLEPLNANPVLGMPDLYGTDEKRILNDLEPTHLKPLPQEKKEGRVDAIATSLQPENIKALVLPGVDEWEADPWAAEKAPQTPAPVEEKPAETEEPSKPVVVPAVKEKPVERHDEKKTVGPIIIATNKVPSDGKRPEETIQVPVHSYRSDAVAGETRADDSHQDVVTPKPTTVDAWILPTYVPEEVASAKENPVEKPASTSEAKPIETPAVSSTAKPHPTIVPVAPLAHEISEEQPTAEKILTPVNGPLHAVSIRKPEQRAIKPIAPSHVKFDLKLYTIKTYSGDLTPSEAFAKGVTKVQPTVQPVFANQEKAPGWKLRKQNRDIQKNGYQDVTVVTDLNPVEKPAAPIEQPIKADSVRDLLKAQKNQMTEAVEPLPEKKAPSLPQPTKPITPVAPAPEKKQVETKPQETKPTFVFKPIKKPKGFRPHPAINPVDPSKK
jgi:hypothetical protein